MKVTAIAVISLDGKLTRWGDEDIHTWSSEEDFHHFLTYRNKSDAVIMGRKMFDVIRDTVDLNIKACRFIMTQHRENLTDKNVPGKLEFVDSTAQEILDECKKRNYSDVLLVGGSQIFSIFAKENLIDELLITIEPRIFGDGHTIFEGKLDLELDLIKTEALNERGTLLLHYKVNK
jgi:dihydrofolate reductase